MKFYRHFLVYKGECFSIYFHAEEKEDSIVYEYYKKCDDVTRASLLFLAKRIADMGHIYDKTKFRIEDKKNKIYVFKPKQDRFFCFFFVNKKIIITSAYRKKKQKLDFKELKKAVVIRNQYIDN